INLHVGGKFICDPHVRYLGGEMVRLKEDPDVISYFELCKIVKDGLGFNIMQLIYFYVPDCRTLQDNLRVVWNDSNIIDMINYWVKLKEIDLYLEHEIDTFVFVYDEKDGNKTEYFDSDDHGSILGLEDDDNTNICRRRSRFLTYNSNLAGPHFFIGMLFKVGEQFKSTIRKYSMCCRRELKIIRNEPNRVRVK
ncbi:hypothetical protein V6Z11_A02G122500, partial [Gossypium hirsutum]